MSIDDVGARCYLRTSDGNHTGFQTVGLGRAALRTLLNLERQRGYTVEQGNDHKWTSQRNGTLGVMVIWLADEDDKVIPLDD